MCLLFSPLVYQALYSKFSSFVLILTKFQDTSWQKFFPFRGTYGLQSKHSIIESYSLEKSFNIIKTNCKCDTAKSTTKLTEGALDPLIQITGKDIKQTRSCSFLCIELKGLNFLNNLHKGIFPTIMISLKLLLIPHLSVPTMVFLFSWG